jgi:glycosyltransferase involved in cell wall biosynthesis
MIWSICIPTLASREQKLLGLLQLLLPQAEACKDGVEVIALHNNGERPLADIRQDLLMSARGTYISFVDDDDRVADDFVPVIAAAMAGGKADYVAFQHALYEDGVLQPMTVHTGIQYNGWYDDPPRAVRDVTHINPVRATIARQADFRTAGHEWEDRAYVSAIRPLLHTQVSIERVMYHYYHSVSDSSQSILRPHTHTPRPVVLR